MRFFIVLFLVLSGLAVSAQGLAKQDIAKLRREEDSLARYGERMINERTALSRFLADSAFIKTLVRALKVPNSFNYPFDSLRTVSHLYAPDSSFRIFSWQFTRDEDYYRQRGAIQMRTADGSLKLFPLLDMSDFTTAPQDSIRTGKNWIGCIYYSMVMKEFNGKKFYSLLGFDDNNMRSAKKWIDVLYFDDNGIPQFGGPFFSIPTGSLRAAPSRQARFGIEYKKEAKARMNYDKELDMIMFDHLISEDNQPDRPYTFVPDGDYQGFKWVNGKWILIDKVFNQRLQDGQAPVPAPLKDDAGNSNESKLQQQSEENRRRQKAQATPPPPAKVSPPKKPAPKQPSKQNEESF